MIELEIKEDNPLIDMSMQNFSYSRLNTFDYCQLQYFYQYIIKVPQTFGLPALLGNVLHKALEVSSQDEMDFSPSELTSNYYAAVEELDPNKTIPPSMIQEGMEMLTSYLSDRTISRAKTKPVWNEDYFTEQAFNIRVGRGNFIGYIDLMTVDKKKKMVMITDYKCVVEQTIFIKTDGSPVAMRDLQVGDLVLGYSDNKDLIPTEIQAITPNGNSAIISIKTTNGRELRVSRDHPVLTERGWKDAKDVRLNDGIYVGLGIDFEFEEADKTNAPSIDTMVSYMINGRFANYLAHRRELLEYNREYYVKLIQKIFGGRFVGKKLCDVRVALDLQHIMAMLGVNTRVRGDTISVVPDYITRLISLINTGQKVNVPPALDRVSNVSFVGTQPTYAITVDGNHTHITDGIATHNSGKSEVAAKRIPENLQLGLYSLVAKSIWPDFKVYAELYYLRSRRKKGHFFTEDDLVGIEQNVIDKVETVLTTEHFKPTPNEHQCKWCSYAKDGTCAIGEFRLNKLNY